MNLKGNSNMKVLVINCGSSSLKFQLIDSETEKVLAKGLCERIAIDGSMITYTPAGGEKEKREVPMKDHTDAIRLVLEALTNEKTGVVKDLSEIGAVGHRVVHGGERFAQSVIIDEDVIKAIEEVSDLAPLHNPANLIGIRACQKLMPGVPMVVVFDTAFHQTMPEEAYLYGLPYEYYKKYKVRRYGFHGTSHSYVSKRAAEILGEKYEDLKIIVCHLGNGASISAVKNGKCIDTSMGFTPLEGMIMGTRCGNIDASIVPYLMKKEGLTPDQMTDLMNKKSGFLGLSGRSSDMRDVVDIAEKEGDERCKLIMDKLVLDITKLVAGYMAEMGGADLIVFTAGVAENNPWLRKRVSEMFGWLGVKIDDEANVKRGEEVMISTPDSSIKVAVIPTDEELMIARDTMHLVQNS